MKDPIIKEAEQILKIELKDSADFRAQKSVKIYPSSPDARSLTVGNG